MPLTNYQPHGSYIQPIPVPSTGPDGGTTLCLPPISQEWLPIIVGCLDQLRLSTTWGPISDAAMEQVQSWSEQLKLLVAQAGPCMELRWSPADCAVQESSDGGTTWSNISGWPVGPPPCLVGAPGANGTNGENGANGTNGITPQLRWSGCSFQVSLDGGGTWTNVSGFDIAALQGCLQGTPGNPQGVSTPTQACNIASWLASQVLQASMSQAATEISGGASLFTAAIAILGVATLLTGVGEIAIAAAAAFFFSATSIGSTNLNAAAADATLKAELTCAIYSAISADGYVTSANFATVATNINAISYGTPGIIGLLYSYWNGLGFVGINAIQGEGSLYVGDCSTCGTWCQYFDFALSDGGWHPNAALGGLGEYVAGLGWRAQQGGSNGGIMISIDIPGVVDPRVSRMEYKVVSGSGADVRSWMYLGNDEAFDANQQIAASGDPDDPTWGNFVGWSHPTYHFAGISQINSGWTDTAHAWVVVGVQIHGDGANPFGVDNCIH